MSSTAASSHYTDGRVVACGLLAVLVLILVGKSAFGDNTTRSGTAVIGSAAWAQDELSRLSTVEGVAPIPYDRDDYDDWLDVDNDCQSARHEVLIAESTTAVTFTGPDECKVESGNWVDPYSGQPMTLASEASIDHVVSLANAHHSGAWRWPPAAKQAFGSDIDDPAVLAVSATAVNNSKGSAPPDQWMPESAEARCAYAIAWVRTKARWQLGVTDLERAALDRELEACAEAGLPTSTESTRLVMADPSEVEAPEVGDVEVIDDDQGCDDRYAAVCIPPSSVDLDCADITHRRFEVGEEDPHHFDGDDNGIGCEND